MLIPEPFTQIFVSRIRKHRYDHARLDLLRNLERTLAGAPMIFSKEPVSHCGRIYQRKEQ